MLQLADIFPHIYILPYLRVFGYNSWPEQKNVVAAFGRVSIESTLQMLIYIQTMQLTSTDNAIDKYWQCKIECIQCQYLYTFPLFYCTSQQLGLQDHAQYHLCLHCYQCCLYFVISEPPPISWIWHRNIHLVFFPNPTCLHAHFVCLINPVQDNIRVRNLMTVIWGIPSQIYWSKHVMHLI